MIDHATAIVIAVTTIVLVVALLRWPRRHFTVTRPTDLPEGVLASSESFVASRLTRGNLLFPTILEIHASALIRRKRSWFAVDEATMHLQRVASVHIRRGLFFADLLVESTGGTDPIWSHGHHKSDAQRLKDLIEASQRRLFTRDSSDATDRRPCPFCGEAIKPIARVCRYCGRSLDDTAAAAS